VAAQPINYHLRKKIVDFFELHSAGNRVLGGHVGVRFCGGAPRFLFRSRCVRFSPYRT
jgi:hypothetical protein